MLVVTQYFWPENFRVNELVREFKNRGYIVEVLTSTPNYPRSKVFPDFVSNPKKYNDYFGVKIHRVPQISRHNNKVSLALNYFSFVISACIYSIINLRKKSFDLIFGVQLSDGRMEQMEMFARVHADGKDVGVITYGLSSELNNYSVAIARLDPSVAVAGTKLTIVQPDGTELPATAEEMPFYDKDKSIRSAKG